MKSNVHSSALRRQDWMLMQTNCYSVAINANKLEYGSHYMGSNHWKIRWKPSPTSNLQKRYNEYKYWWGLLTTIKICGRDAHIYLSRWQISYQKHQIQMDGSREKGLRVHETSCWKRCSTCVSKFLKRVRDTHRYLKDTTWGCTITIKMTNCFLLPQTNSPTNMIHNNCTRVS